jgi:alanine racemase
MELQISNQYTRQDQKVHIYSQAFLNNLKAVRSLLKPETKICAVVKANGYGHGIRHIVKILKQGNVDFFAVANIYEAQYIADIVGDTRILVLEPVHISYTPDLIRFCAEKGIHCAVVAFDSLEYIQSCLKDTNTVLNVHVKVETGMGRCGIEAQRAAELIKKIRSYSNLKLSGVYTHFSTAAEKNLIYAEQQYQNFSKFLSTQSLLACKDVIIHASSSAATLNMPKAHFDMVRCGIALYGWADHPDLLKVKLEPTMKFEIPIVQINHFRAGQPIGYGRTYTAWRDTIGAIVPIGYADNYWRLYSNNAFMKVGDKYAQVLGRVSMDKTVIDITDLKDVKVGQYVTVIDNDPESMCSVYRLAEMADTICHEILTALPSRAMRIIH